MGLFDSLNPLSFIGDVFDSTVGSLINYNLNSHQQNKQNDYNLGLYKLQREDALADRAHLEQYNSPKNQMDLYRLAGLNPNLVYSQMGNTQTVLPNNVKASEAAGYTPYKLNTPSVQQALINEATRQNIEKDTELKESQRSLNEQKAITEQTSREEIFQRVNLLKKRVEYEGFRSVYYEQLAHAEWMLTGFRADTAGSISETWKMKAQFAREEIEVALELARSNTKLNYRKLVAISVQNSLNKALENLAYERAESEDKRQELTDEQINLAKKEKELKSEQVTSYILRNGVTALTYEKMQKLMPTVTWSQYIIMLKDLSQALRNFHEAGL